MSNQFEGPSRAQIAVEGLKFVGFTMLAFWVLKLATYIYTVSTVPEFSEELDLLNQESDLLNEEKQQILEQHPEIYGIHRIGAFDHIPEWKAFQDRWDEHMEWNSDFLKRVAQQSIFEFNNPAGWSVAAGTAAVGYFGGKALKRKPRLNS